MDTIDPGSAWAPPDPPPRQGQLSRSRRVVATVLLAFGLMAAGGVAIVNAASPDPSASPAPRSSGGTSGGTASPAPNHNCPNMPGSTSGSSG